MKAPDFAYLQPSTLEEALAALARHGDDACVLAGGQTLMALQNFRMASTEILVDINRIPGLSDIHEESGHLVIGALVRYAELEASSLIERFAPLLSKAVRYVAHPAIRNRGTIGGSLALGDPAAEMPACMLALNAEMVLRDLNGERGVPADRFFLGLYETALKPDEVLTAVRIPKATVSQRYAFDEVARRRGDFALAGLAIVGEADGGTLQSVRMACFGVADRPILAASAMAELEGQPPTAEIADRVRDAVMAELDPPDDPAIPAAYRRHLGGVLATRLLGRLRRTLP